MTVFETLRDSVADEWERLLAHPFVSSMADGTLRPETFRFYLRQDDYYLDVLLRCMGAFVSRAPDRPARRLGVRLLAGTLSGELEMHDDLIGRDATEGLEVCDAALAYEAFLLRIAMEGDATAILVSMTPCIASYREIAARYEGRIRSHIPAAYAEWFATYGGDEYGALVEDTLAWLDGAIPSLDGVAGKRLRSIFSEAASLERRFWDDCAGRP